MIPKIAFLFLTLSNLNHEQYWHDFFAGHEEKISIYAHAKDGVNQNSLLHNHTIATVPTTWANTMHAQRELLKAALANPENQRFIFVSESTIPLVSFEKVYTTLFETEKSIFPHKDNPHVNQNDPVFYNPRRNLHPIPEHMQKKGSQWIILNRKHTQMIVDDPKYFELICKHPIDNEHYPQTFLHLQEELDNVHNYTTTYVNWVVPSVRLPYNFHNLHDAMEFDYIKSAIDEGFLFARKFTPECDLSPLDPYLAYRNNTHKTDDPQLDDAINKLYAVSKVSHKTSA